MQATTWDLGDLKIPALRDDDGSLYFTEDTVCFELGVTSKQLETLAGHDEVTRPTDKVWPLDSFLQAAFLARTDAAWRVHKAAISIVKQNATIHQVH